MKTFFLKYRPQKFADLVGQASIVKTLKNAIKNNRPAHAYLFSGSRGTGKTSSARIFAKALNCTNPLPDGEIGECPICDQIAAGDLVDVVELDAASNTGVDNIRDIIEKVQFLPTYAKRKVYIIDEVHMLSKGAFNALLKTLEEPPEYAFFILATTELHKVPETIVSRCQTFMFGRFTEKQLVDRLQAICEEESIEIDIESLAMIAKKAEGGLRDAIGLLEQLSAETENKISAENTRRSLGISSREKLEAFWEGIQNRDTARSFSVLQSINQQGGDFRTFGHDFLSFLREAMHTALNEKSGEIPRILATIEAIETAVLRIKSTPIVELPFEIAVVQLCLDTTGKTDPIPLKPVTRTTSPKISAEFEQPANVPVKEKKLSSQPESKSVPAQSIEPTVSQNQPIAAGNSELSADQIKSSMEQIAMTAGVPIFVKKSFLTAKPQILGSTINFSVASSFHLEQLDKGAIKSQFADAIQALFGVKIIVEFSRGMKSASSGANDSSSETSAEATADDFLNF